MARISHGELEQMRAEHTNRCVCCGEEIPEGRQVCPICEARAGLSTECEKMQFPPDYIDRRKLTAKMRELISTRLYNEEDMLDLVNEQPRADVVEIVMCKDCKYWEQTKNVYGWCDNLEMYPSPDWYCADGKRRKDNDA